MELFSQPLKSFWDHASQVKITWSLMPDLVRRNLAWLSNQDIDYLVDQVQNVSDTLVCKILADVLGIIGVGCPSQSVKVIHALELLAQHEDESVRKHAKLALKQI